jgi:hypothetical protein
LEEKRGEKGPKDPKFVARKLSPTASDALAMEYALLKDQRDVDDQNVIVVSEERQLAPCKPPSPVKLVNNRKQKRDNIECKEVKMRGSSMGPSLTFPKKPDLECSIPDTERIESIDAGTGANNNKQSKKIS